MTDATRPRLPFLVLLAALFPCYILAPNFHLLPGEIFMILSAEKRFWELVALVTIFFLPLLSSPLRTTYWRHFQQIPRMGKVFLFLFFSLGSISSLASAWPVDGIVGVGIYFLLLHYALVLSCFFSLMRKTAFLALVLLMSIGALIYASNFFVAFYTVIALNSYPILHYHVFAHFHNYENVRYFGHYHDSVLFLLAAGYFLFKEPWVRRTAAVLLILWWCLMIVTGSRGAFLFSFFAMFGILVLFKRPAARFSGYLMMTMGVGILVYLGAIYPYIPEKSDPIARQIREPLFDYGRAALWRRAFELGIDNPFLGVGPRQYAYYSPNMVSRSFPHNAFLQIYAEWGIPAFTFFCLLILWALFAWFRQCLHMRQKKLPAEAMLLRITVTSSLILLFFHAQVSDIVVSAHGQLGTATILGMALSLFMDQEGEAV